MPKRHRNNPPPNLDDWIARVADRLEEHYGRRRRRREDPLDCLIRTILSQNTSDTNRDRAFRAMRDRFPTWEDVRRADRGELADAIRPAGLANNRSKTIQDVLNAIDDRYGALSLDPLEELDDGEALDALTSMKGVGVKTARCVLMFAMGRDVFPVDTHIRRIAGRIGWAPEGTDLVKTTRLLADRIPDGRAFTLHLNLIRLGREICTARTPFCHRCFLVPECETGQKTVS
jgi:endonuclease-3